MKKFLLPSILAAGLLWGLTIFAAEKEMKEPTSDKIDTKEITAQPRDEDYRGPRSFMLSEWEFETEMSFTLSRYISYTSPDSGRYSGLMNVGIAYNIYGFLEPFVMLPALVEFKRFRDDSYINQVIAGFRIGAAINEIVEEIGGEASLQFPNNSALVTVRIFSTIQPLKNIRVLAAFGSSFEHISGSGTFYELLYKIGANYTFWKYFGAEMSMIRSPMPDIINQSFHSDTIKKPLNVIQLQLSVLPLEYLDIFVITNTGLSRSVDEAAFFQNITTGIRYRY